MLALAVKYDLDVEHMDVVTAFIQGNLTEKIFMKQPEGFVIKGKELLVCYLKKPLYGLKQSSYVWKLNSVLTEIGFVKSNVDQGIFVCTDKGKIAIIAVYVDDLLIVTSEEFMKVAIKKQLHEKFKMT